MPNQPPTPPATSDRVAIELAGFPLGPYQTNCYVVRPAGGNECWIIDASFSPRPLVEAVRKWGATPTALILTHGHIDHLAGVDEVRRAFPNLPVLIHAAEAHWTTDPQANLSALSGMPTTCHGPDRTLKHDDVLTLGASRWRVLHVPGHSPGSIALVCENAASPMAISGDALFAGSIGRTDFPGCSAEALAHSIRTRLYTLDPATEIFPGHGPRTTIGHEMRTNPYVRA